MTGTGRGPYWRWPEVSLAHLSARADHRVLKLARTIADLAGSDRTPALRRIQCGASVQTAHIAEAVHRWSAQATGIGPAASICYYLS